MYVLQVLWYGNTCMHILGTAYLLCAPKVASGAAIYPLHLGPARALRTLLLAQIYSLVFTPFFMVPVPNSGRLWMTGPGK
ncbi:hypothetical protein QBC34DRAFT_412789 [Podospora aff. communis PSN243]|uniref:Uncharacterized protein n=1 Tax=Podospora aff. communis PSN243 TaxID=3040156 RepID=A0AAV9GD89_9PEZI|nr:hypothetical protein QBC34DRAFT_412789 [Podospora aff. communis PSN243]